MIEHAWLIPLFPLVAFLVILLMGRWIKEGTPWIGAVFIVGSLLLAVMTLMDRLRLDLAEPVRLNWLELGEGTIYVGYDITVLNAWMLVIVSVVSLLVHLFARGYMAGDDRIHVFYAYLTLFTFSMLGLVMSPNLLQLYIFWELVGVCSFLLVGFYFYKPAAKAAAKKAFIMTRIGDMGLLIGIILLFWHVGSFEYDAIFGALAENELTGGIITLTALLIFVGAVGKSGQLPLHSWLPDAMEGPTPVSALIHAATMVAAGVYLVAVMFPLFEASPLAMNTVAYVGAITAIFAASVALVQHDIKRILAFSTISQLGYMMLALGVAGYVAGLYHLLTHAFFKALLFLAAGAVIHAIKQQDIRRMGGLFSRMKLTGTVFLIGCLALAGIPPLSGFFSKEEIFLSVWAAERWDLLVIALITALMTAFYIFRLFFLVFTGSPRTNDLRNAHDPPLVMSIPLVLLAGLSVLSGLLHTHWTGTYLGNWLIGGLADTYGTTVDALTSALPALAPTGSILVLILTLGVAVLGIVLAYRKYVHGDGAMRLANTEKPTPGSMVHVLARQYYIDDAYRYGSQALLNGVGAFVQGFEKYIVQGAVRTVTLFVNGIGSLAARLQNGQLQTYVLTALFSITFILIVFLIAGGYWQ